MRLFSNKKGIELAIGTVAIIALVLLVVIIIIGFFLGAFGKSGQALVNLGEQGEKGVSGINLEQKCLGGTACKDLTKDECNAQSGCYWGFGQSD